MLPYRAWTTDTAYAPVDHSVDPALRGAQGQPPQETREWPPYASAPPPPPPADDQTPYIHAPYQQPSYTPYPPQVAPASPAPSHAPAPAIPLPRHTYTRTLVGPLSANACRLLDEHRKPGIFFLFQDLSVRTEGKPAQCAGPRY